MPAGTCYDIGAPTLCESDEEASTVVGQWSDVENVYVRVDDLCAHHGPGDILGPNEFLMGDDVGFVAAAVDHFPAAGPSRRLTP